MQACGSMLPGLQGCYAVCSWGPTHWMAFHCQTAVVHHGSHLLFCTSMTWMLAPAQGLLQGLNLTGSSEWSQIRPQLEDLDRLPVMLNEVHPNWGPHNLSCPAAVHAWHATAEQTGRSCMTCAAVTPRFL